MAKAMSQAVKERLKKAQAAKRQREVSITRMPVGKLACCLDLLAGTETSEAWTPAAARTLLKRAGFLGHDAATGVSQLVADVHDIPVMSLSGGRIARSLPQRAAHVRLIRWPAWAEDVMRPVLRHTNTVAKLFRGPQSGRENVPVVLFGAEDVVVLFALLWPPRKLEPMERQDDRREYTSALGHVWDITELVKYLRTYVVGVV